MARTPATGSRSGDQAGITVRTAGREQSCAPAAATVTSAGVTYTICPEDEYAYWGPECPMCNDRKFSWFYEQLAEYEAALEAAGAVITIGGEQFIDESTVPALPGCPDVTLLTVYEGLEQFGYANGLL